MSPLSHFSFILEPRDLVKTSISPIKAFGSLRKFLEDYGSFREAIEASEKLLKYLEGS